MRAAKNGAGQAPSVPEILTCSIQPSLHRQHLTPGHLPAWTSTCDSLSTGTRPDLSQPFPAIDSLNILSG